MTELTATVVIKSLLGATADDATPIIRRLARNQARVFLDSRAGDAVKSGKAALSATPAPAVDAVPAGEVGKMVETLRGEMAAEPKRDWYPVHRDYLDAILTAALSHGEGR